MSKLTSKDLKQTFFRNLFASSTGWNYEKMMGLGYCYAILPVMKKLYQDPEVLKRRVKSQLQFFNCTAIMSNLVLGANMAIEESEGEQSAETITALKTGLMGPLSGVGDTIFGVTWGTVFFSIAAYMAIEGSPIGCILALILGFLKIPLGYLFLKIGYNQGAKVVDAVGGTVQKVTQIASMVGLTVVGALIPTVVTATSAWVYKHGKVTVNVQTDVLDKILPSLIPVALVALTYWLLGRKHMNSTRVIFILLILAIALYSLKVLA
ncbi:PTS system mannose/fructose/sorbose family transporter subunit IID [Lacticaseibacillus daqingensis]|uniref:PTS system mannose/fructose/sorbose family transporter subunit IID n=1 Tax=Lacticaseibacillus daqingensis TaxID=2486014 RepID=UPI001CDBBDFA|nr:PTS system mannose/fructose/sorbose family transporter subunit IID [Lacticaseibacillus daqingensis]